MWTALKLYIDVSCIPPENNRLGLSLNIKGKKVDSVKVSAVLYSYKCQKILYGTN